MPYAFVIVYRVFKRLTQQKRGIFCMGVRLGLGSGIGKGSLNRVSVRGHTGLVLGIVLGLG